MSLEIRGFSSAGRAPALQAGGQRFDPANLHHIVLYLNWLERTTDNRKVGGSSPLGPTKQEFAFGFEDPTEVGSSNLTAKAVRGCTLKTEQCDEEVK